MSKFMPIFLNVSFIVTLLELMIEEKGVLRDNH